MYPHTGEERQEDRDRAVLVGVDRGRSDWPIEESLAELERLAETAGAEVVAMTTQRLDRPNPRTFIGKGKAEQVGHLVEQTEANLVLFDDELTPSQQANIDGLLPEVKVLDRTALILDIFAQHATSREGKLQVELAQQEYLLPRLRGLWAHLKRERLGGGVGARFGAGESQLESDRRLTRKRISELKADLRKVDKERGLQRKARARAGVYRVALVGYTNAGKSTLLNRLTGASVLVYDMLFATLDSTTRKLTLPEGREVTITDTVGFINKLPHGLVEAFKSTLDEVNEADLLLFVTDAADTQREAQMQAVREVLQEIGAHAKPGIEVFNKADRLQPGESELIVRRHPKAVLVSALTGDGIEELLSRIAEEAARGATALTVLVPYTRGDLVKLAHERAQIISERHIEAGTQLVLRAPAEVAHEFDGLEIEAELDPDGSNPTGE
ncbi:MAG: GTPase HflX [Coriobacteriales bacterium]|nr:GTPase HflX [Coriobacteriales bacterium]